MKLYRRHMALILALIMLFSLTGCGKKPVSSSGEDKNAAGAVITEAASAETEKEAPEAPAAARERLPDSTYFADSNRRIVPEYVHYDPTGFFASCEKLREYIAEGKSIAAMSQYDSLLNEMKQICTMGEVAYVMYCEDVTNEQNKAENEYAEKNQIDCGDRFNTVCHELAVSPMGEDFRLHLNDDGAFQDFIDYVEMSEEEKNLKERETELENRYYEISDAAGDYSCELNGKTYKLADINNDAVVGELEQDELLTVYSRCMEQFNEDCGEVFLELLDIRGQLAELNGYDNYADYADAERYSRDYTGEDLESFHAAVRDFCSEYGSYWGWSNSYMSADPLPANELMELLGCVLTRISPYCADSYAYIMANRLFSVGTDDCRLQAGYTTQIDSAPSSGYIFYKSQGSISDLTTMIHEMGHFTENRISEDNFLGSQNFDLAEIASTGLQVLASPVYYELFDEEAADIISAHDLEYLISCVVEGCMYDEWQREVYCNPGMTLDEINDAFKRVQLAYGGTEYSGMEYEWIYVNHNFDAPMYYISYAASAIVTLQLAVLSGNSYRRAVSVWEGFIDEGSYGKYLDVVERSGLSSFRNERATLRVLEGAAALHHAYLTPYMSPADDAA